MLLLLKLWIRCLEIGEPLRCLPRSQTVLSMLQRTVVMNVSDTKRGNNRPYSLSQGPPIFQAQLRTSKRF
jgi:hypothetical protein